MLKVAIVGCGKIADSHASQIKRIPGCRIIAACDREELMASQFAERFGVGRAFSDAEAMLNEIRPDVVHVTTPPQSHYHLGRMCLHHGAHVYVEKPFTLNTREAQGLIALAEEKGLKVTAGHDDQFRNAARRLRNLVAEGYLGGAPVHMESYYCYELSREGAYAKALLGDKSHWVRQLPGGLLHNTISHGIARIAEYFTTARPQVIAHGFVSPVLREMGETQLVDELRVIVSEADTVTAYFTFSAQMRPSLHQFRIYGPKNGLLLDQENETLIRLRGRKYKSYLEQFFAPVNLAGQYFENAVRNVRSFIASDFHMKGGMKYLIESFYLSIVDDLPPPLPYREILLTAQIMDQIFDQITPDTNAKARRCIDKPREAC